MDNVKFFRSVRAQVELTAEQWQLYTASMDCSKAAYALNRAAEVAIGNSRNSNEAILMMSNALKQWADYGASDSEPYYVVERLMLAAFNDAHEE